MKRLSVRRRHPWAAVVVLLIALGLMGTAYSAFAPSGSAEAAGGSASLTIEEGKSLFITSCSSCHGLNAEGTSDGPSLIGVGAAAVDFQVGTGRMPMQSKNAQAPIKPRVFNEPETAALAAYVQSLAPGPAIPTEEQYAADGDIQEGGEIFRTNCASCHGFVGNGGALTRGKYAVSLTDTSRKHLYEAMLTGPQSMPVFNDGVLTPEQKKDVITYLKAIGQEPDNGGNSLGRIGPVSEGLLMWTIVLGVLVGFTIWLGAKAS
ncbi:MAG: cytochrome bc1 complex diheme cytochrome c subunit [Sporichthyaceae bacterium]